MGRKRAYVYFYASYWAEIYQILKSDIFQLKLRIRDKNNLFATLNIQGEHNNLQGEQKIQ